MSYNINPVNLTNVKSNDKFTFTELIEKLQNHEKINLKTKVYINMHDMLKVFEGYLKDIFEHIPTGTKVIVEYDEKQRWSHTEIILPNTNEEIWIGDEIEDLWYNATTPLGAINGFEMEIFEEIG